MTALDKALELFARLTHPRDSHPIETRLDQARRDLRMIADGLGGRSPAPFLRRDGAHHYPVPVVPGLRPRTLRVLRIERETPDAVSVVFVDPTGEAINFAAGQFFTLLVRTDGELQRRAYSASNTPETANPPGSLRVTVKRMPGGRVSGYLNDTLKVGDEIGVFGPSGNFTLSAGRPSAALLLIAGGSGATPMISLARASLARFPERRVFLLDGNRSEEDILFRVEWDALLADHPSRLVARHVLSSPPPDWVGGCGQLTEGVLRHELASLVEAHSIDLTLSDVYLCGPEAMMASARTVLSSLNLPPEQLHEESFSQSQGRTKLRTGSAEAQTVMVKRGPRVHSARVESGDTLLEAGLKAGVEMPFSCTMGGCGACKVRVLSGEIAMDEPNCLTAAERAEGFALSCVGHPTGPTEVEIP